jgi:hypothetical protein
MTGRFLRPRNDATCDIGYMVIDNVAEDERGSSLGAFLDIDAFFPLTVSPGTGFLRPGARVAWAGFPAPAHGLTGAYHLCYSGCSISRSQAAAGIPDRWQYFSGGERWPTVVLCPLWQPHRGGSGGKLLARQ